MTTSASAPLPSCSLPQDQHADVEARRQRAEESRRSAEAEVAGLRQRLAVAEGAVRAREREVEKAVKGAQADDAGLVAKVRAGRHVKAL